MPDATGSAIQTAELVIQTDPPLFRATVNVTPQGVLAIASLVSSILLSTCAIIWIAGNTHRKTHFPSLR